ncbi:MAG: alcohol dehydrogenase catalytic domain-containing protein [Clostridia bacterium]|nr:alcohol dehydrogenase catalytic domain-containing protein [Clostridia bacterium]
MKAWEIVAPEQINAIASAGTTVSDPRLVKVKIEMSTISSSDKKSFESDKTTFPLIPGRHGTGIVSETAGTDCFLQKGDKVVVDPYIPCGKCSACRNEDYRDCSNMQILGVTENGLYCDFVTLPVDSVLKIPTTLGFESAVFAEYVSLAVNALSKINISKGDYVAIVSGSKLGYFIAQLVSYYQGVPILIDQNDEMLALAKNCGIEYTINPLKSKVMDEVYSLTGGRMCEKSVYLTSNNSNGNLAVSLCGYKATLCLCGLHHASAPIDLKTVCDKQLTIVTENNGHGSMPTAINLLAKKAVVTSGIVLDRIGFDQIGEYMKNADAKALVYKNTLITF